MNDVYANFIQELMEVTGKVAIVKNKEIKINSQEWFNSETSESLYYETKNTKTIASYRQIYKQYGIRCKMSLRNRRKNFLKINTKCVAKPKTQKAHKSLGLPD